MSDKIARVVNIIRNQRLVIGTEKSLQVQVAQVFDLAEINYTREVRLDDKNIIDFMIDDIGIELKIKGRKREIYKQLCRYAEFPEVAALILVTTISLGLPAEINKKKVFIINPSRAWL